MSNKVYFDALDLKIGYKFITYGRMVLTLIKYNTFSEVYTFRDERDSTTYQYFLCNLDKPINNTKNGELKIVWWQRPLNKYEVLYSLDIKEKYPSLRYKIDQL